MRRIMRQRLVDFALLALLFLAPLVMFWPQTVGGRTLLPTENLYQYEPYATYREVVRAPEVPHNHLLSDLALQNMQWKALLRDNLAQGEIPLWNSHQFSGIPFMAAGQQSALYPLSILYYVLPLTAAYGWFTVLNLWLAGAFMYLFVRGLGVLPVGGLIAALTYQLCGFFIASAVFPMITGAAAWLPLILLMIEFIIRRQPIIGRDAAPLWVAIGAVALACNIFAGHIEMTIYTLLIAGYYAAGRLLWDAWRSRALPFRPALWLVAMVVLGLCLGALQLLPLYEFANTNWRAERSNFAQVLSYTHPLRDLIQFAMPNFYGNPSHHSVFDWFRLESVPVTVNAFGQPITHTEWGIKNYVESALYVGILPLVLAAFALVTAWVDRHVRSDQPPLRPLFALLGLLGLTFMFGLPTYALVYFLPGINQLNSAFRWIYAVTFVVAVLAGFGTSELVQMTSDKIRRLAGMFGAGLLAMGGLVLAALLLSRLFYPQVEPLMQWMIDNMVTATGEPAASRFADARMFYSYQFTNALIFGLMSLGSGLIFTWAGRDRTQRRERISAWQIAAGALVAVDLMIASWGFNAASDPLLLDFTPPSIQWLQERQAQEGPFRYITFEDVTKHPPLFQANMTLRYGLDDVRGYDSIIPAQYVEYMRSTSPQPQLDYNRIAPLYADRVDEINWTRLSLLNVRYLITHRSVHLDDYLPPERDPRFGTAIPREPVYEDEAVRIWQLQAFDRAFTVQSNQPTPDFVLDNLYFTGYYTAIYNDTGREKLIDISLPATEDTAWLVVSETYMPGWRAFIRPRGGTDAEEQPLDVARVLENFIGIRLPSDNAEYTVRLVYSPASFQIGLFASIISGGLLLLLAGMWAWGFLFRPQEATAGTAARVARNSLAPIILNLFNRGIDFAFAFVMLRVLGPENAGLYQYAVTIFVWFDIFTNFGLNTYLTREVARDRSKAGYYLLNTSLLRLGLVVVGIPLLVGFIAARQNLVASPLSSEAIIVLVLLYAGLLPSSLSTGLTALYYAFEKAEVPAAVATLTTLNKAVFGLAALLMGWGIVGLAGVSIILNFITLAILLYGAREMLGGGRERSQPRSGLMRGMLNQSWPLMLNHFLATIFFQIDIIILEASQGTAIVGKYGVAYKWLMAINVIPAFFTQALLPVMARQAEQDVNALRRTVTLGLKLLLAIAVPLAVVFTFSAQTLTLILGGAEYLPEGAIALQIMIWSILIGWMNSLTQYVLIALDVQRRITGAFAVAVTFNIVTNIILIPHYGYVAAALTTIASELVLFVAFGLLLRREMGGLAWTSILPRPVIAGLGMLAVVAGLWAVQPIIALSAGSMIYLALLVMLRPLSAQEIRMLLPILPGRLRTHLQARFAQQEAAPA
ncbi:MAG: oligosaccharide flippase family protein [bacterium]|nr:oligosaccharide flippase family protein [bacterium]